MRMHSLVTAALLYCVAALPSSSSSSELALDYNSTEVGGNNASPEYIKASCRITVSHGERLDGGEVEAMRICYNRAFFDGQWHRNFTCPGSRKKIDHWGNLWIKPERCAEACRDCWNDALDNRASAVRCYRQAGFAGCNVVYN
ncbi:hypothetical protein AAE478_006234 [Parahypoxylon ruwenzoriense]